MRKSLLGLAVSALLAALLLSGCRREPDPNSLQLEPETADKTVLTLFMPIDAKSYDFGVYKDVILAYNNQNETTEIRVDGIATGDGFNDALMQRLSAGDGGADIFIVNADSVKPLYSGGYFYDLTGFPGYEDLSDEAKTQCTIDKTVYAIPLELTTYELYVNTGLLEEYGLTAPQNRSEFLYCCEVLKKNGITPMSLNRWYSMTAPAMAAGLYPIYQSKDKERVIEGLNDGSILIGDYMLEGFQLFDEMAEKGYYGDQITGEEADARKAGTSDYSDFISGRTAFAVFTTYIAQVMEQEAPELHFIRQGFPVLPDGMISLSSISVRLCVNAKGEHVEEALEAVRYMTKNRPEKLAGEESGFSGAGQIPVEDMSLHFNYWDVTRELCLKIIDGMTPEEAAQEYNRIQKEQVETYAAKAGDNG